MNLLCIFLLLTVLACPGLAYNYLVFDPLIMSYSHTNFMGKVADTLTNAGHNVTVLMPVCDPKSKARNGLKTTTDIIVVDLSEDLIPICRSFNDDFHPTMWNETADPREMIKMTTALSNFFPKVCQDILAHDDLLAVLKARKFDAGIAQPMILCGLGLFEGLGIPATIATVSSPPIDAVSVKIGQPTAPSYVPSAISEYGANMSFWQRFVNTFKYLGGVWFFDSIQQKEYSVLKEKFGQDFPSPSDILSRASFHLVNTNPFLDFPYPTIQKVIPIGGISVNLNKEDKLSEEWDQVLAQRPNNILISFGSVAQSHKMPNNYKAALVKVFRSMPDTTFIWKYENNSTEFAAGVDNVYFSKWVPQNALLADSRLSIFVTHGGLGSTTELAHLGKPGIMVPLFADQPGNAARLSRHGGAVVFSKFDLDKPELIQDTFEKVLNDKSYAVNAKRVADMLQNQPVPAKDLLVKYCEFAARFGELPNLDPHGRHMNILQYFLVDVMAAAFLMISSVILVVFLIVRKCFSRIGKVKKD